MEIISISEVVFAYARNDDVATPVRVIASSLLSLPSGC